MTMAEYSDEKVKISMKKVELSISPKINNDKMIYGKSWY